MSNLFSIVTGVLGGVSGYLAIAAVCLGAGGYGGYRFELGTYEARVAADARAETLAARTAADLQKKQDQVSLNEAVAEARAQQKIVTQTVTLIKEVPVHVTPNQDAHTCISFGLVRLLDAATLGVDPSDLSLPAGQSDDTCAPVKASALAAGVAGNIGAARANAEQLNALQDWVRAEAQAARGGH